VCAVLMLFCEAFWNISMSGLPQMLMLLLFSCGIYFVFRAVEAASEGRIPFAPAIIAGVFFTLLALTHWMTVWIAIGYIIFAAVHFRPRGFVGLTVLAMILIPSALVMLRNQNVSGSPFGMAIVTLYGGLSNGSESTIMRTADVATRPELDGLIMKIVRTTLLQTTDIIPFLGGIIVAPLFFLSLLHPFKRASIANFRWALLLMWVLATLGMGFFGITKDPLDPNQLHILFAPIMTAYGLAFISILWSRLEVVAMTPFLKNVHYVVIVGICVLPLVIALPSKIQVGLHLRDRGGHPNWPPYLAGPLNSNEGLKAWTTDKQVIFSDQPWATAWYADRMSIWLPPTREGFEKLENIAVELQTPVAGILISPTSHGSGNITEVMENYKDFAGLVLNGRVIVTTSGSINSTEGVTIYDKSKRLESISKRYPRPNILAWPDMLFYSDKQMPQPQQTR
jgi:hypothetical protein